MGQKEKTPSPEQESNIPDSRSVLDLLNYTIRQTIDERANAAIRERNKSFLAWLAVIAAIVTTGAGFTLTLYVDTAANNAVAKTVGVAQFESQVAALNFRILHLDQSEGFTSEQADAILLEIQSLVASGGEPELRKLVFALDTAVLNFAAADRLDLVSQLENIAPNWSRNSAALTVTMVHTLGLKLLADAEAPDSWTETTGSSGRFQSFDTLFGVRRSAAPGWPSI